MAAILIKTQKSGTGTPDMLWRAIRRLWMASAIGLFPILFILDGLIDVAFSPVLPGIVVLILLWIGAPYAHVELLRKSPSDDRVALHDLRSKVFLGVAITWVALWLVFA